MLEWRFADGTRVLDDGTVEGESNMADELRGDVVLVRQGFPLPVSVYVEPGGSVPLELDKSFTVHRWLVDAGRRWDVGILSQPDPVPETPPDPRGELKSEDGVVY